MCRVFALVLLSFETSLFGAKDGLSIALWCFYNTTSFMEAWHWMIFVTEAYHARVDLGGVACM